MILHERTHPGLNRPDCFGCRVATVNIGASATPFRREQAVTVDKVWDKQMRDDKAYTALRRDGLQPRGTSGCHELAQVDDHRFIEGMPVLWDRREEYLMDTSDTPQVIIGKDQ